MGMLDFLSGPINWRFQQQENTRQRAYDTATWKAQNEYNSPKNQMQRYRDAGLNPNLMYGQGNSGNAAPAAAPKYQKATPNFSMPDPTTIAQIRLIKAQTENVEANTRKLGQSTETEEWNTEIAKIKASMSEAQYQDFQNQMTVKWGLNDDGTLMKDTPGAKTITSESQIAAEEAEIRESKARIQKQMEAWFKANNLAKMIPAIEGLLRLIK